MYDSMSRFGPMTSAGVGLHEGVIQHATNTIGKIHLQASSADAKTTAQKKWHDHCQQQLPYQHKASDERHTILQADSSLCTLCDSCLQACPTKRKVLGSQAAD
jgi:NAD-dependent dihydropyrimidine dehydrogenase PreA subunit